MSSYANPVAAPYASAAHVSVLRTVYHAVRNWRDAQRTRHALSRLTDRELNDIGLTRDQIEDVALYPFR